MRGTGEERPLTVVIESADPWLPDRAASVTIVVNGLFEASGRGSVRVAGRCAGDESHRGAKEKAGAVKSPYKRNARRR